MARVVVLRQLRMNWHPRNSRKTGYKIFNRYKEFGLEVPAYSFHEWVIRVTRCGRMCFGRRKISLSTVFGGQYVGIREFADEVWLVSFMDYNPGFFEKDEDRVEPVGHRPNRP